jgi:hypothetical protein
MARTRAISKPAGILAQDRKSFFFEKKNQKTSVDFSRGAVGVVAYGRES